MDGSERVSVITMVMYTSWTILIGAALLRLRIDYDIGSMEVIFMLYITTTMFALLVWYKIFMPWNDYVLRVEGDWRLSGDE